MSVGSVGRALEAMVADESQAMDRLPLLPEAERRLVVEEWNATDAEYPADTCVHELFEAQVERTPGAVAVVCGDRSLTYAEQNARANRLSHHLRGRGVGPAARVAQGQIINADRHVDEARRSRGRGAMSRRSASLRLPATSRFCATRTTAVDFMGDVGGTAS